MTNEEDKQFLQMQQEDPSSSSMCGVDQLLAAKEGRKRIASERANAYKKKAEETDNPAMMVASSTLAVKDSKSSTSSSESEDEFQPSTSSVQQVWCHESEEEHFD